MNPSPWRVLRDLFRKRCWQHTACLGTDAGIPFYADQPTKRYWWGNYGWRPWSLPWLGCDEDCRWTLVLPLPYRSLVIALWACRDPRCDACVQDCLPIGSAAAADFTAQRRVQMLAEARVDYWMTRPGSITDLNREITE